MKKCILFIGFYLLFSFSLKAQIADKAENIAPLLIGEILPNEIIYTADNKEVELLSVLSKKPSVVVFYRGGWCPFCNQQLGALGEIEAEILKLGYQIIAISPDDVKNLFTTTDQNKIQYQLFSDSKGLLIQKVGIAFTIPEKTKDYISKKTKGQVSEILPVPTVMVVNTKGEILFEYINPNYKTRISSNLLLAVLQQLAKE